MKDVFSKGQSLSLAALTSYSTAMADKFHSSTTAHLPHLFPYADKFYTLLKMATYEGFSKQVPLRERPLVHKASPSQHWGLTSKPSTNDSNTFPEAQA